MIRVSRRLLIWLGFMLSLAGCATVPSMVPPPEPERRIALSFDDTPRAAGLFLSQEERARRLIAALDEAGVAQAAFFVNPGRIADAPHGETHITAYAAAGHVIANHTANHISLTQNEVAEYIADIDAAEAWLAGRDGYRPWFRYPYLNEGRRDAARRDAIRNALRERGLVNGYVTVDGSDWFYEDNLRAAHAAGHAIDMGALRDLFIESHVEAASFFDDLAVRTLGRSPVHMLLLHEADLTTLFLPELVAALRRDGWTIVTADEAYADPMAQQATTYDTPSAQGTLTEMLAWQAGLPAPRWYARNDLTEARRVFDARVLGVDPQEEEAP